MTLDIGAAGVTHLQRGRRSSYGEYAQERVPNGQPVNFISSFYSLAWAGSSYLLRHPAVWMTSGDASGQSYRTALRGWSDTFSHSEWLVRMPEDV